MNTNDYHEEGLKQARVQNHAGAIPYFRMAVELDPFNTDAMFDLATALCATGKDDEGIEFYKAVLVLEPETDNAHTNLAVMYFKKSDVDLAFTHCVKALELNPYNHNAHAAMANILGAMGEVDKALEFDRNAVMLAPDDVQIFSAYAMRTLYSSTMTQEEKARIHFEFGRRFGKPMLFDDQA